MNAEQVFLTPAQLAARLGGRKPQYVYDLTNRKKLKEYIHYGRPDGGDPLYWWPAIVAWLMGKEMPELPPLPSYEFQEKKARRKTA